MKLTFTIITVMVLVSFLLIKKAEASQRFNYPDNFRHTQEMILDNNHDFTKTEADQKVFRYFFDDDYVFKERTHPERYEIPEGWKREFKEPMSLWQMFLDRLQPKNIFDFSNLTDQLNTPQRIATAVSLGWLMDNDRSLYKDMDTHMRKSEFWKNNGDWLSHICDGFAEVAVAGCLSLTGNKKNQQVAQMLMESAMSLRVIYIKRVLGVTRPSELVAGIGPSHEFDAMPSGHTWVAFSMATILGEAYEIKWLTYPLAVLSGLSRIQQNTHWPSDVLAGGLLGHLESREILARHGYIPSTDIGESRIWDKTRVDMDGGIRVFYDSYSNMDSADRIFDRVGRLDWRWTISQSISPAVLLQANYHWRGQIPSIASYNSAEDVLFNPRLAVKAGKNTVLMAEYNHNKIQFGDLGTSYHHPERARIPSHLNYSKLQTEKGVSFSLIQRLSPSFYVKPLYSSSVKSYSSFDHLKSNTQMTTLEVGTTPQKGNISAKTSYGGGFENAEDSRYNYNCRQLKGDLTWNMGNGFNMKTSYIQENRKYNNQRVNYDTTGTWQTGGIELSRKFNKSWQGEIGYYRRSLTSGIPNWSYEKDIYFIQIHNEF